MKLSALMVFVMLAITLSLSLIPYPTLAKRGGHDDRARYYGIIESRPLQGLHGDWVIGGRTITTAPNTEFDQREGALAIGSCAKVDSRNGRIHEIDSEPLRDCL
ncbi:MAG: hypothetical protein AB9873_09430 [Syntrophobacteraceae bacterium]